MYSAVIPSLGRLEYINDLIVSILNQTIKPDEIIILLDANDHCREVKKKLVKNEVIKIYYCNKMNLAEKRNYGVAISRCDDILFSDDDDIWHESKAERVIYCLKKYKVCCHNYGKFGFEVGENFSKLGLKDIDVSSKNLLFGSNIFGGGSSISAKKNVLELFPFNPSFQYCEDYEWWIRVIKSKVSVKYLSKTLVFYRTHDKNMTSSSFNISKFSFRIVSQLFQDAALCLIISVAIFSRSIYKLLKNIFI